jgi:hypothetical protein
MMLKRVLAAAGLAAVMTVGMSNVFAQPGGGNDNGGAPGMGFGGGPGGGGMGGNFDPAQMRQMMTERMREELGVTDEAEWKAIEPKLSAVMEARQASGGMGGRGMGMMGGRNRGNRGGGDNADQQGQGNGQGNNRRNRGGMMGQQSAAAEALQAAILAKAPAAEIKTKLEAYRADVKTKEAALAKAQEDLKKLLSAQQEAILVLNGMLK